MYIVTIDTGDRVHFIQMEDEEYFALHEDLIEGEVIGYPVDDINVCTAEEIHEQFRKVTYDQLNQEINIGDVVLFPVRHSSTCWLEQGKVEALKYLNGYDVVAVRALKTNHINYRKSKDVVVMRQGK